MAQQRRILRLQNVILQTAANHIQRELEDPRIGLVSITRVKLSPDLTQAQVYWSVLGDEAEVRTCERGLENALPSIQRAVADAMQTRVTPKLQLRHDPGLEHAQRLEEIFTKLREERGEDEEPADDAGDGAES
ncbi:MAG: 30S ribosome-binding factor RbfA [Planctomycetota bacterium]|nr:30S ribosome-binding factor RbfA [Planctomycetota bacterium]